MLTLPASALAVSAVLGGCVPAGELTFDGSQTVCFFEDLGDASAVFGLGMTNTGTTDLTITDVELLQQNTVLITEIAATREVPGDDGFGTGRTDQLFGDQVMGWESRTPAIGTVVPAGERAWLLIAARTGGPPEQRTGLRGVRIEFDGAPWPRSTHSDSVMGFGPLDEDCDAGIVE